MCEKRLKYFAKQNKNMLKEHFVPHHQIVLGKVGGVTEDASKVLKINYYMALVCNC